MKTTTVNKIEGLFWHRVLLVSTHDQSWACGEVTHHGGSTQGEPTHLMTRNQKKTMHGPGSHRLWGHTSNDTITAHKTMPPPLGTTLGTKLLMHMP